MSEDHKARLEQLLGELRQEPEGDGAPPEVEAQEDEARQEADGEQEPDGDTSDEKGEGEGKEEDSSPKDLRTAADHYFARQREKSKDKGQEDDLSARIQKLQERIEELQNPKKEPEPKVEDQPEANPHDRESDPIAHGEWELEQTRKRLAALEEKDAKEAAREKEEKQLREQDEAVRKYAVRVDEELQPFFNDVPGFRDLVDDLIEKMTILGTEQGVQEHQARKNATLHVMQVAYRGEIAGMPIARSVYGLCDKMGLVPQVGIQPGPKPENDAPAEKIDLKAVRQASRRAPGSLNARPGSRGGQANALKALASKRDREWTKEDVRSVFDLMRQEAGV